MKRQLLFIQGGGAGARDEWDDKLVDSLTRELGTDYEIRYPQMPNEDDPSYGGWKSAIEKEFAALGNRAILVGHSIGGTMLVNTLAAPYVGDGGWSSDELKLPADLGARLPQGLPVHIFYGLEDETAPLRMLNSMHRRSRNPSSTACPVGITKSITT